MAAALLVNTLVLDLLTPPGTRAVGTHSLQKSLSPGLDDR